MDDKMNRQLTCQVSQDDSAMVLSHELVHLGFIHEVSLDSFYIFRISVGQTYLESGRNPRGFRKQRPSGNLKANKNMRAIWFVMVHH